MSVTNLDYLAATHAQKVISRTMEVDKATIENAITEVLSVLQEQGVYACFVFALSRAKSDTAESKSIRVIVDEMANLLKQLDFPVTYEGNAEATLKQVVELVTQDLEQRLLAKDMLEQMLIYARYGAKARSDAAQNLAPTPPAQGA